MAEELSVVLRRTNDNSGLGFSLLGTAGLPPIIYDIVENSPAAESGEVEAGDIILKVNETDVNRFSTKEVLRCLRLSEDPIRLILKRDPAIKEKVIHLLSAPHDTDEENSSVDEMAAPQTNETGSVKPSSNEDEFSEDGNIFKFNKSKTPRFEAFMMTGDLILNLSRTQQTSGIFPKHQKKVDSLRYYHKNHHRHEHHNSVPTSPNESDLGLRKNSLSSPPDSPPNTDDKKSASCYTFQTGVRTSKSEDHLQFQKNSSLSTVDIDIDDDVTSSLNTLLDTRPDGDRMVSDQCNAILERLTTMQNDDKSSESLDFSSNKTVLRIEESPSHPENSKTGKSVEGREKRKSGAGEEAVKHRHSGSHERQQKSEHRRSGHLEKADRVGDLKNADGKPHSADCLKLSDCKAERSSPKSDRIVWSCNASHPNDSPSHSNSGSNSGSEHNWCCGNGSTVSSSSSPQRSLSPASPTSVSSSIMSSNSSSFKKNQPEVEVKPPNNQNSNVDPWNVNATSDISASEAVSNISSPDYQEEITLDILSGRDMLMEISDPSDSDSTILVSDPLSGSQKKVNNENNANNVKNGKSKSKVKSIGKVNCDVANSDEHKIVIQVKGPEGTNGTCLPKGGDSAENEEAKEKEGCDEFTEDCINRSPQSGSDEESDIESLRSFHYSPKAVDIPSAERLAKRLYTLDGFKKSDVSRHLSKNNDFSRAVAEEYLKYFSFTRDALDTALRKFLKQFSLTGETQERERVLVHFSKRYLDCNPGSFNSQDAVHTLTCAIMLLNTDLHGQNINRKMTCEEFIDNLRDLNEGENFPRDVLKSLYQAIKNYPLEWALDDDGDQINSQVNSNDKVDSNSFYGNPFLGIPNLASAIEYKKGYVMRKCCVDPNGKKTPFGKRGWKMFYCTLLDLVLYLHKDERGFLKAQLTDNFHNAIRIHHSLATKAQDYNKKQHVFRLETAEQAEYLFQTSDSKELQSWIDTINFVSASYSSQPLAGGVGSENKFQRPLLPCSHTKLNLREQLADHEDRVQKLELALEEHRKNPPDRSAKSLVIQNYKEKDAYLQYEIRRYKTYVYILRSRMPQYTDAGDSNHVEEDAGNGGSIVPPPVPDRRIPSSNSYS
ncbi:UNVERIFIED_CONTAM: hypothetical protein PYX00_002478 [Menopon gallinae]|uniref:PH and SEC7 domain-containing protein 4 n=1 Tax=Menopon gallinae TaxID=328185 RepID=A0AAW2IGZ4_9NEOP